MSTIDKVRALFVKGEDITCVSNTYHEERGFLDYIGKTWTVAKVGKTVWTPEGDGSFRGTFPKRASDVLHVDDSSATWKIGRKEHTVTYSRVPA